MISRSNNTIFILHLKVVIFYNLIFYEIIEE